MWKSFILLGHGVQGHLSGRFKKREGGKNFVEARTAQRQNALFEGMVNISQVEAFKSGLGMLWRCQPTGGWTFVGFSLGMFLYFLLENLKDTPGQEMALDTEQR